MINIDINSKYPFAPLDNQGAFFFPTDNGCYYTVAITEAGYKLWASDLLSSDDKVFELSFDRKCDDPDPGFDQSISNTIIQIFGTNISSKGNTCVYYHICEHEKGKGKAKLYDNWFKDLATYIPEFDMFDFEAIDEENATPYYTSLFIHKNNPDSELIRSEFKNAIGKNGYS